MSATSDPRHDDAVVLRPRLVRIVGLVAGGVVLLASVLAALAVPHMTIVSRGALVVFGLGVLWFCWREASVRIIAERERVVVRNLFGTTVLEWPQIVAVSFPQGDPWAHLDLADGDTLGAMALQRSDGDRGLEAARTLARMVRERGEAPDITGTAAG